MDKIEPEEPMDRIEPVDAIDRIDANEPTDRIDMLDAVERMLRIENNERAGRSAVPGRFGAGGGAEVDDIPTASRLGGRRR